ncbi:MAG: hypothetical protein AB8B87_09045 [Granulosicoccus sp.]
MKSLPEIRFLTVSALVACLMAGCSLTPVTPEQKPDVTQVSRFEQLVSRDVVSVLMQVDRLSPTTTTLGTSELGLQQGAFAEALKNELMSAGYAIRTISAGPDTIPVSYKLEQSEAGLESVATQNSRTVTVIVGDVAVRRTYTASTDGHVVPVGSMQVRGVDARRLQLDNEIFSEPAGKGELNKVPESTPAVTKPVEQIARAEIPAPASSLAEPSVASEPQAIAQSQLGSSSLIAPVNGARPLLDLVAPSVATARPQSHDAIAALSDKYTKNVRELEQSNFESLFSEMGIVGEKVLTFANDSTRMGDLNKARLQELLRSFDPEKDVLSVVGCSLGPTNHTGGQEGLARGRAMRVREELLYAGVPESQILAEGCWAEETFDERMPRRGVVVTLKRPIS